MKTIGTEMAYPSRNRYDKENDEFDLYDQNKGLTKREVLAASAMEGIIASGFVGDGLHPRVTAQWAVKYADALIFELNKDATT